MKQSNLNVEFRRFLHTRLNKQTINPLAFRDLTVTALGSFVTNGTIAQPKAAEKGAGYVYDLVMRTQANRGRLRLPLVDDTTAQWFLSTSVGIFVDCFTASIDFGLDQIQTSPIRISNSLIQDSTDIDLLAYINTRIEKQYQRTLCQWITKGNGSCVTGLVADPTTFAQYQTTSNTAVTYNDLTSSVEQLDSAYLPNAVWTMNLNSLNRVCQITDNNLRPVFNEYDSQNKNGFAGQILGLPVTLNPALDNIGPGNVAIQLGDFSSAYTLVEVLPAEFANNGMTADTVFPYAFRVLTEQYAPNDETALLGFNRVAGAPTVPNKSYSPLINVYKA